MARIDRPRDDIRPFNEEEESRRFHKTVERETNHERGIAEGLHALVPSHTDVQNSSQDKDESEGRHVALQYASLAELMQ